MADSTREAEAGRELSREWLRWVRRLSEVNSVDFARHRATIQFRDWPPLLVVVTPSAMIQSYRRLVESGRSFWPALSESEAAWRMLSVDLFDFLESEDEWVESVELSAVGPYPGFVVSAHLN